MNVPHELDCGTVLVKSENKGTITTWYFFSPYQKPKMRGYKTFPELDHGTVFVGTTYLYKNVVTVTIFEPSITVDVP